MKANFRLDTENKYLYTKGSFSSLKDTDKEGLLIFTKTGF